VKRYRFERSGLLAIHASAIGIEFAASPWGIEFDAPRPAPFEQHGSMAVVTIRGPLTHHADWWCDSYDSIKERCAAAFASSATKVALRIASPGGDTSGCFETALELRAMVTKSGKELYAFGDGMATSAAYALACAADAIIAPAETLVGSIGVISGIFSLAESNKKEGLAVEVITSGDRKADGNPNPLGDPPALPGRQSKFDISGILKAEPPT
jgi:ClpP class serine protease